eukprot:12600-Rhodomonas_salina.2
MLAMRKVLELPPMEFFKRNVSLESRYGTCLLPAASAMITFPNAVSERLMFVASRRCRPSALLYFWRSDPARSTRWKRDSRPIRFPSSPCVASKEADVTRGGEGGVRECVGEESMGVGKHAVCVRHGAGDVCAAQHSL